MNFFLGGGQKFVEEDIDGKALLTKRLEEDTTLENWGDYNWEERTLLKGAHSY